MESERRKLMAGSARLSLMSDIWLRPSAALGKR
jgi:hypothetical protein